MYYPFPEEDSNIKIDELIEDRLFSSQFANREPDEYLSQFEYEMLPYLSPDDNPDDLEGVL
jgi:hypothetical protein